ncbi:MAG: hypothetical protein M1573_02320 [Candidatus Parvarchaeota archaeon]|nr:hypothetical protein [Candidatus Parvarchaeota archaeon]
MEPKYKKFILAVVIAGSLMAISFFLGYSLQTYKASIIATELQSFQQNLYQLQVSQSLETVNHQLYCSVAPYTFAQAESQAAQLSNQVTQAQLQGQSSYSSLMESYTYSRIELWTLGQSIAVDCGGNYTTLMLIYSPVNCNNCVVVGNELSYLNEKYPNIMVSSIDGNYTLPVISSIDKIFNVTQSGYPYIIFGGKYVLNGYQTTSSIENEICSYSKDQSFCNSTI